ncbi:MAG TPA: FG-GAP-like repeat-containing protein, partial [Fluviicola sp.]|nr:FG-GAP-like repeat-containing protein [Fluviicola sp.]
GDIVVTNNGSSNISVLNSTGSTTHAAAVTIAAGYTNPYAVVILDYDLDGKKDVIISSSNGLKTLNRFKGDGAGGLTANGTVGLSSANYSSVKSLEAKDVDGDGDEDIFVGETGQLGKIANPGVTSGSAATNTTFFIKNTTTPGISGEIRGIHIVDVNNDGKLDAVAVFNSGPFNVGLIGVAIATSFGTNAGYVFTANSKAFASETNGSGIGMADFNSDGKIDAIISNQSSNSTTLHLNTTPTITAGGPTTFCNGNLVQLTSSAADFWYEWSPTLETTQSINAVTTGNYYVTTSSSWSDWCTSESDTITVTVTAGPTAPTITAGGSTTICGSGTVTLTSSSPTGNQWFLDGDTISGATSQNYVASVGGTYTVTFNNGTCSSDESNAITVTVSQAPIITAGGPTTFCNGGSVVLTSDVNSNITWSPGGETTQNITVTSSGSYYVTNTVAGCPPINSNTIVVTVTTVPTPTITASGPITFCAGGSVTLTSSSATGNTWSTGATTQSINVTTSGSYYVYVTSGGCNSANSSVVNVTVNAIPSTPTITASGPTTFCAGGSVTLTSSAGSSYLWS